MRRKLRPDRRRHTVQCLALIDRVHEDGESITITKRGRTVARLIPAGNDNERPWLRVRGTLRKYEVRAA